MKRGSVRIIVYALFIALFGYVIASLDVGLLREYIANIPLQYWPLFLALFFLTYFFKAYRFRRLHENLTLGILVRITIVHNFFLALLPFRLGELAYVRELKKNNIMVTRSISDIVVVRLFDVMVLALLSGVLLFYIPSIANTVSLLLLIVSIVAVYIFLFQAKWVDKMLSLLGSKVRLPWGVEDHVHAVLEHVGRVSDRKKIELFLLSIVIWFFSFLPWVLIAKMLLGIAFPHALVAVLASLIASIIPINPPGGIGVIEGGWLVGLLLVGVPYGEAANFSLFAHAILFVHITLFYVFALVVCKPFLRFANTR